MPVVLQEKSIGTCRYDANFFQPVNKKTATSRWQPVVIHHWNFMILHIQTLAQRVTTITNGQKLLSPPHSIFTPTLRIKSYGKYIKHEPEITRAILKRCYCTIMTSLLHIEAYCQVWLNLSRSIRAQSPHRLTRFSVVSQKLTIHKLKVPTSTDQQTSFLPPPPSPLKPLFITFCFSYSLVSHRVRFETRDGTHWSVNLTFSRRIPSFKISNLIWYGTDQALASHTILFISRFYIHFQQFLNPTPAMDASRIRMLLTARSGVIKFQEASALFSDT